MSDYPSSKQVSSQCLRDVKDDPESAAVVIMQQSAEIERLRAALEAASVTNVAVLLRDSDAQNQRLRAALSEIAAMRFDTTYVIGAKEIARRALAGLPHETKERRCTCKPGTFDKHGEYAGHTMGAATMPAADPRCPIHGGSMMLHNGNS